MNTTRSKGWVMKPWVVIGLALCPAVLSAQKRDDLIAIQRDVADLEDKVKQLQKTFDDRFAAVQALLQQVLDASGKTAAGMTAMQREVDQKLGEQQKSLVTPLASLGSKVEQTSEDVGALRANVQELVNRLNSMDTKVTDISNAVRMLAAAQTPAPAPPGANPGDPNAASAPPSSSPTPPAGMSAELLYQNASRDFNSKKDKLAMDEFVDYLKYFGTTANAPNAQYYIAELYFRNGSYVDAADAYDAVLEKFPQNPRTPDAQYMKGVALMKAGRKTDAGVEFRSFIKKYPDNPNVAKAHQHLRELGLDPPKTTSHKK